MGVNRASIIFNPQYHMLNGPRYLTGDFAGVHQASNSSLK